MKRVLEQCPELSKDCEQAAQLLMERCVDLQENSWPVVLQTFKGDIKFIRLLLQRSPRATFVRAFERARELADGEAARSVLKEEARAFLGGCEELAGEEELREYEECFEGMTECSDQLRTLSAALVCTLLRPELASLEQFLNFAKTFPETHLA